jgi:hypothetical protein
MMKPRIVILSPPLAGIPEGVASGFERAGCAVAGFSYGLVRGNRLKGLFPGFAEWERAWKFHRTLLGPVRAAVEGGGCDLLLVLKGARLHPRAERFLAALPCPLALWTFDSLGRVPGQEALARYAAHAFYMDGGDIHGDRATWLPLGYDERIHHPTPEPKEFDLLFVGRLGTQYRRRRVGFVGSTGSRAGDAHLDLHPGMRHVAPHLAPGGVASCIAKSSGCVNNHQDDGGRPVNPTFFAIPGSGACQVAEDAPHLARWLEPGKQFISASLDTFIPTLESLLDQPGRIAATAEAGRREARERHTYALRARQIMTTLGIVPAPA